MEILTTVLASATSIEVSNTSFLYYLLSYIYLFMIGSMVGYLIELLFRRFVSMKRWINPGFLKGPYLPLYGLGTCILYTISDLGIRYIADIKTLPDYYSFFLFSNDIPYLGTVNFYLTAVIIIVLVGIFMTLIELVAGLIFIKGLHIKLWDYSKLKGNFKGIIAPIFSLVWTLIGALYFFLIHPLIYEVVSFFNNHLLGITFICGVFTATFIIDLVNSVALSLRLSKEAKLNKFIIDFEQLKIKAHKEKIKVKKFEEIKKFLNEVSAPIKEKIGDIAYEAKRHLYVNNEIPTEGAAEVDETPRMKEERLKRESLEKENNKESE